MRDKKKTTPGKTPEQEALEKHVDAMMDPKQPDDAEKSAPPLAPATKKSEPAITAIATPADDAPKTAPQLSPKLSKQISVTDASAKPLSIDKLDELTKTIAESETPKKSKKSAKKTEEKDEPEQAADIAESDAGLDDAETDKAVDDIVAYESDVMLAVADSTAEAHSKEASLPEPKKRGVFSTIIWTLVALVAILIVALSVLLVMGDNLATKLGI